VTEQDAILAERFVAAWEKIAHALEGLNENYRKDIGLRFPERGPIREAVLSRVPTEEDRLRETQQGPGNKTLMEWLSESPEPEPEEDDIGVREREWLERKKADAGA
jgi:hypothetical protein